MPTPNFRRALHQPIGLVLRACRRPNCFEHLQLWYLQGTTFRPEMAPIQLLLGFSEGQQPRILRACLHCLQLANFPLTMAWAIWKYLLASTAQSRRSADCCKTAGEPM